MAANIRPRVPYGTDALPTVGARLLEWLKANPFSRDRVLEQVWRGRAEYQTAMSKLCR